ncbi:MAG: LamB/YcsF family protein [Opitutus sp.]|nr:LamB/YcsF family protein [Opitutus sp.]MCS6246304.1 LamB/YcsF family protein [Opitutus sp.]MCS6273070.1 LamB/YcsF family protein [Opitutus sp.]MCS6277899.1 LamB/YcsF family protein [Opitutus sp.]MCS6298994.1 LamB/YcsF family protein [Opitutus sp.]
MASVVDLNCDLGEGGGDDAALLPLITSANIACGAHAGDTAMMRATVRAARQHGLAIGAHPGFADREFFGRRELALPPAEIDALVYAQVVELRAIAINEGAKLTHVKPHGALYNLAARDVAVAHAVAAAVARVDAGLWLYGLAGGQLLAAGRSHGLRVAAEVFADRTYLADGSLTPRDRPGAVIVNRDDAVTQVLRLLWEGRVRAVTGEDVIIAADTVCLHGDGAGAAVFARGLRAGLLGAGVQLHALG